MTTADEHYEEVRRELAAATGRARMETFPKLFLTRKEEAGYKDWLHAKAEAERPRALSPGEFTELIDSSNLIQESFLEHIIIRLMADDVTTVPIGHDQDLVYRLLAGPDGLVPHNRHMGRFTPAGEPLLPYYILGVNTTVQPREPALPASRRKANLSEVSRHSAESDDNECPRLYLLHVRPA